MTIQNCFLESIATIQLPTTFATPTPTYQHAPLRHMCVCVLKNMWIVCGFTLYTINKIDYVKTPFLDWAPYQRNDSNEILSLYIWNTCGTYGNGLRVVFKLIGLILCECTIILNFNVLIYLWWWSRQITREVGVAQKFGEGYSPTK